MATKLINKTITILAGSFTSQAAAVPSQYTFCNVTLARTRAPGACRLPTGSMAIAAGDYIIGHC